jgi:hypothetical protein
MQKIIICILILLNTYIYAKEYVNISQKNSKILTDSDYGMNRATDKQKWKFLKKVLNNQIKNVICYENYKQLEPFTSVDITDDYILDIRGTITAEVDGGLTLMLRKEDMRLHIENLNYDANAHNASVSLQTNAKFNTVEKFTATNITIKNCINKKSGMRAFYMYGGFRHTYIKNITVTNIKSLIDTQDTRGILFHAKNGKSLTFEIDHCSIDGIFNYHDGDGIAIMESSEFNNLSVKINKLITKNCYKRGLKTQCKSTFVGHHTSIKDDEKIDYAANLPSYEIDIQRGNGHVEFAEYYYKNSKMIPRKGLISFYGSPISSIKSVNFVGSLKVICQKSIIPYYLHRAIAQYIVLQDTKLESLRVGVVDIKGVAVDNLLYIMSKASYTCKGIYFDKVTLTPSPNWRGVNIETYFDEKNNPIVVNLGNIVLQDAYKSDTRIWNKSIAEKKSKTFYKIK